MNSKIFKMENAIDWAVASNETVLLDQLIGE